MRCSLDYRPGDTTWLWVQFYSSEVELKKQILKFDLGFQVDPT